MASSLRRNPLIGSVAIELYQSGDVGFFIIFNNIIITKMNKIIVLNFAPYLLTNIPYQNSKLAIAVNQMEENGKIFFRVSFSIEHEGAGTFELEVQNEEKYKNGEFPIFGTYDKELNEIHKPLINKIGKLIEIYFKKLI